MVRPGHDERRRIRHTTHEYAYHWPADMGRELRPEYCTSSVEKSDGGPGDSAAEAPVCRHKWLVVKGMAGQKEAPEAKVLNHSSWRPDAPALAVPCSSEWQR